MKARLIISFVIAIFLFSGFSGFGAFDEARKLQDAFTSVAEKAFPAVVVIHVKKELTDAESAQLNLLRNRGRKAPETPKIEGKGSGFIADENGYIITNCHVASGSDEINVKLYDGREFKAEIVGTDEKTDIALLKIKADGKLPFLNFADSDKVKVGHWSIAIGAPFNLDYSMTVGIVSQKGRSVGMNTYENYIQTDAAINMGNSGGPLLNIDGEVIGVNDFIMTGSAYSQGNIGLGFAIPSNMVKDVMEQLMKGGKVVRPWVGIMMETLSPDMKKQSKIEKGVLVREVNVGNPADKAGIEPGDVIISVDGSPVAEPKDIQFAVLKHKPGDKIIFTLMRDGKKMDITVVAEKQDEKKLAVENPSEKDASKAKDYGLEFAATKEGIEVSKVKPGSPANDVGIEAGLKIIGINKMKVRTLDDVNKALAQGKDSLLLYVSDGHSKRFIVVEGR